MSKKHYIDTGSVDSNFCMPKVATDYEGWLLNKYKTSQIKQDGRPCFYGIAQRINHLIFEAKEHEHKLIAFGENAKGAANVIESLSFQLVTVEVANNER